MKSTEFIFALVLVLMLPETSSSPSIFSVMYVPRFTELAQLGLGEMMWGDNTVDWERLHTTVSMQTRDGRKAGCRYRVSVVPVDGDGLPIAVIRGQARELGCEVQLCGLNDGDEECVMSNGNYSDVMGKCHLSIPTSLAEAGNGYRWVGVESTAISVEAGCQLSSESLPGLTALLEPYTAVYECASDEFWSQDVQECLPCETDDTTYLCSPGFYVKGCDSLAHVMDESTICSPCPNTPADFASGHYRWKEGEECVLECDQGLFYMNGTVCEPCTELLRTCTDEESNYCCAKQAGQMWRACTATENEACVDCPAISKSIYSENEEFIPWSHECEHYLQEDGDLSALCECHTTCKDGFYRSLEPDLLDTLPCVPCSGMVDLAVQARLTRTSNEFFRYQQCTKASNTQLVQCVGKPIGCDGVPYSTVVVDICGVCGGSNDTCTGCDGVVASGAVVDACGLCGGDNTTCAGCDGVPNSGLVEDVCGQCGGDNTSCWGCDNISNSGLVFDVCGECGGDGSSCWGCDNVSNSGLVFDACNVCGGDNATCTGCDGVLFSGKALDSCGVCDGGNQALDGCGVCYGDNTSCVGCDGIFKSGVFNDSCGVCGGDNSTCAGCDGIPYSGKVVDVCDVCGGDNSTCIGCDGVFYSGKKFDECNVCGGDNTSCECDIGYTGPQYGKLSGSCVPCGPGTYKDVIGSAACTECGFNTYNPEYGSTSNSACLPCMEHSETEEIYGHESIHACMCVSGYYHDTPTSCTACTPGTFNAEKNQTQCSNCSAGYYSNGPNSSTCEICPHATYSYEGSALCTQCNLNASSPQGSASINDCQCTFGYTNTEITQNTIPVGTVSVVADSNVPFRVQGLVMISNTQSAVFDTTNRCLKVLNIITGLFTTVAGYCAPSDSRVDGTGTNARFKESWGMVISQDKTTIYIPEYKLQHTDTSCAFCSIRKVIVDGWIVSTLGCEPTHHFYGLAINSHDEIFGMSNTYDGYDHPARISKCNPVSGLVSVLYQGNNNAWCGGAGISDKVQSGICAGNSPLVVTPDDRLFVIDSHIVHSNTYIETAIIKEIVSLSVVLRSYYDVQPITGHDDDPYSALAIDNDHVIFVAGYQNGKVVKMHIDTGASTHIGNYQNWIASIAPYDNNRKVLAGGYDDHKIWSMSVNTTPVQVIFGHCMACAAGTYKDTIGPQTCEPCASCPAGQYRLGCTTSSPGACVDCPNCGEGQYRVNCANQSTGECVACLAYANITWHLEDADEGLTGGSSPDQSCDQICAEQNMVCDQSTLDGPIRYNNEAPALLFLEDIVRDSGYDQLSGSNGYNAVGDNNDACRIVPYFGYYSYYGYGYWTPEAREAHACTQTSQCSAIASDISLSTSYKYQRLCPCTCGANHYVNGCGGTSSGVCTPCETCPSGQYRQNCSLYDPGVCVNCSSCPQGQIISGCEGQSAGECQQCGWKQQFKPGDVVAVKILSEFCLPGYFLTQCMYTSASQYSDLTSQYDLESITGASDRGFWIFTIRDSYLHTDNTFRYTMDKNLNSATVTWLHAGFQNDVFCLNGRLAEFPSGPCGSSPCHCEDCPSGQYRMSCLDNCQACNSTCPTGQYLQGCSGFSAGTCVTCDTLSCIANHYVNGCGGTNPGVCTSCETCPSGQYRQNCSLTNPGSCVNCSSCPQGQIISGCEGQSAGQCQQCGWEQRFKNGDIIAIKTSSWICNTGNSAVDCMYTSASQFSDLTSEYDLESITGSTDKGFWIWRVTGVTGSAGQFLIYRNFDGGSHWMASSEQDDILCLNGRLAEFPSGACGLSDCH